MGNTISNKIFIRCLFWIERNLRDPLLSFLSIQKEKKGLGFSEKTLNNTELTVARTTNVANALSGKISGVRVAGNSGMTGSSSAIFIHP